MNEYEDLKRILDEDEEIIKTYKPNRKRFLFLNLLTTVIFGLLFFSIPFVLGLGGLIGFIAFTTDSGARDFSGPTILIVIGCVALFFFLMTILGTFVRYKRTLYVLTNKRLLIRSGFIGVDYKSMQLSSIGVVNVRVDFLDKLVHPNTGTITFASNSAPMGNQNGNAAYGVFNFAHIDDPYEAYKELKSHIGK